MPKGRRLPVAKMDKLIFVIVMRLLIKIGWFSNNIARSPSNDSSWNSDEKFDRNWTFSHPRRLMAFRQIPDSDCNQIDAGLVSIWKASRNILISLSHWIIFNPLIREPSSFRKSLRKCDTNSARKTAPVSHSCEPGYQWQQQQHNKSESLRICADCAARKHMNAW